jgi:Uma2 family endonuclease
MPMAMPFTSGDLDAFPDDGKRYEIIDGELYVSGHPNYYHQLVCGNVAYALWSWNRLAGAGIAVIAPGIIFGEYDDVVADVIWISKGRLAYALGPEGHLHQAPELVAEVIEPGHASEGRDRGLKLDLYSRRGVREYWIVDRRERQVELYRRKDAQLQLAAIAVEGDLLDSPLLPRFSCDVRELFVGIPVTSELSQEHSHEGPLTSGHQR